MMADLVPLYLIVAGIFAFLGGVFTAACHHDYLAAHGAREEEKERAYRRLAARITLLSPVWPLTVLIGLVLAVRLLWRWAR